MASVGLTLSMVALGMAIWSLRTNRVVIRGLREEIGRLRGENYALKLKLAEYEVENG